MEPAHGGHPPPHHGGDDHPPFHGGGNEPPPHGGGDDEPPHGGGELPLLHGGGELPLLHGGGELLLQHGGDPPPHYVDEPPILPGYVPLPHHDDDEPPPPHGGDPPLQHSIDESPPPPSGDPPQHHGVDGTPPLHGGGDSPKQSGSAPPPRHVADPQPHHDGYPPPSHDGDPPQLGGNDPRQRNQGNEPPLQHPEENDEPLQLDPRLWRACAGTAASIPSIGSTVFYFPEGHAELSSSPPNFPLAARRTWRTLCRISNVRCLVHSTSDELYVELSLNPIVSSVSGSAPLLPQELQLGLPSMELQELIYFAKKLTPTDISGAFLVVPLDCARILFPPIDLGHKMNITLRDIHNVPFDIVFTCRGQGFGYTKRFYLERGWRHIVSMKNIEMGDTIVFVRNDHQQLVYYIRRPWKCDREDIAPVQADDFLNFRRTGRVLPEAVVEAASRAGRLESFSVTYFPLPGSQVFVVGEQVVNTALNTRLDIGTRIKLEVESPQLEDCRKTKEYSGSLISVTDSNSEWPGSRWRNLKVVWDGQYLAESVRTVCWEFSLPLRDITNFNAWQVSPLTPSCLIGHERKVTLRHNVYPVGRQEIRQTKVLKLLGKSFKVNLPPDTDDDEEWKNLA